MRYMYKTLLAAIFALGVLYLPAAVLAQSPTPAASPTQSPRVKERRIETFGLKNCEALKNRVKGRLTHYRKQKENHLSKYNKILERGQKVADVLREKGYDQAKVDKLEDDLAALQLLVEKFETDANEAIAKMETVLTFTCEANEAEIRSDLEVVKMLLGTVRADVVAIKEFVKNTLRADIRALKTVNPKSDHE